MGKYFSLLPMAEKGAKENQSDQIVKYCIILHVMEVKRVAKAVSC